MNAIHIISVCICRTPAGTISMAASLASNLKTKRRKVRGRLQLVAGWSRLMKNQLVKVAPNCRIKDMSHHVNVDPELPWLKVHGSCNKHEVCRYLLVAIK